MGKTKVTYVGTRPISPKIKARTIRIDIKEQVQCGGYIVWRGLQWIDIG